MPIKETSDNDIRDAGIGMTFELILRIVCTPGGTFIVLGRNPTQ